MDGTILVTGATGNTGATLVDLLLARGAHVRAMVRQPADGARWAGRGVEVVTANFDDVDSLARALDGARAAYLITPSSSRAEQQQVRFAEATARAGVAHLVKLSQLAADLASPVRFLRYHAAVERRIRELGDELGLEYTFLRPNLFFQGLLAMARPIREYSRLVAPIGAARVSAVDVRDIAAVAAVALTEPGHTGATYTITGTAAVTHAEIAAAIATATDRDVNFEDIEPEAFAMMLRGVLPDWQVDGLLEDYAHYARSEAAEVSATVEQVTGCSPRSVARFAADHADWFR